MKTKQPSPYFRRVIEALGVASPLALAAQFEDGLGHCVEASISGAAALRRRKIKARAVPCAIMGVKDGGDLFSVGLSARDAYNIMEPEEAFEEWSRGSTFPVDKRFHAHMVIEASGRLTGSTCHCTCSASARGGRSRGGRTGSSPTWIPRAQRRFLKRARSGWGRA